MKTNFEEINHLPNTFGVYLFRDSLSRIIYIGKANRLKSRVASYFQNRFHSAKVNAMRSLIRQIDYIPTETERDSLLLEQQLIHQIQPIYNTIWRDDKSFPYVKLTLNEEYPRLFLTRKKKNDGAKVFGPYPYVGAVKNLIHTLRRKKMLSLRPCNFDFKEREIGAKGGLELRHPALYKKVKSCIYLHTGECPAPCVSRITKENYRKIAFRIELLFKGEFDPLKKSFESEMREASKNLQFERAKDLRDQLQFMEILSRKVRIQKIDSTNLGAQVGITRALTELQKVLNLPKPPNHIEAFDISNIQGTEPVASMVTFEHGKPLKSGYRKYKFRTVNGPNDFAMMEEAVRRRVRRLLTEGEKLPDLILIDGGKGQLRAALKALETAKAKIPLAALAKQKEEIFLPNQAQSIELPKDSPALHILQHVRDEAHRFAVTFHRLRRNKKAFRIQQ